MKKYIPILFVVALLLASCSAQKRAERKKQRDMETFVDLLKDYPQIQDTVVITVIDTLIIPEQVIEYQTRYKRDTVYVEKAIDSTLSKLEGIISDAQRLTLARDIRTIVVESKALLDTTFIIEGNEIRIKNNLVTHRRLPIAVEYEKESTSIQVKPEIEVKYPFYKRWWFSLLVLVAIVFLYGWVRSRK